jgi:energy-coupling factor transport system substrate-specific component
LKNLLIITLLASLGLATKSLLNPLARFLLSTLAMPGGVLFGGLYMMWLALARGLVGKSGSATLTAFVQGGVALVLGLTPVHGLLSAVIFLAPGIFVDVVFFIPVRRKRNRLMQFTLACLGANLIGIVLVALVWGIVRRPLILLASIGALSGGLGGLLAYLISEKIHFLSPQIKKRRDEQVHPA